MSTIDVNKIEEEFKNDQEACSIHICTQCGKIDRKPFGDTIPNRMLSCDCTIAKPWKWIWTEGWAKAYRKQRIELGIDKPEENK